MVVPRLKDILFQFNNYLKHQNDDPQELIKEKSDQYLGTHILYDDLRKGEILIATTKNAKNKLIALPIVAELYNKQKSNELNFATEMKIDSEKYLVLISRHVEYGKAKIRPLTVSSVFRLTDKVNAHEVVDSYFGNTKYTLYTLSKTPTKKYKIHEKIISERKNLQEKYPSTQDSGKIEAQLYLKKGELIRDAQELPFLLPVYTIFFDGSNVKSVQIGEYLIE